VRARVIGIGLSLVFLAITVSQVNLGEFVAALGQGQYAWVIPAALTMCVGYALRGVRWWWIVGRDAFSSRLDAHSALIIGFAANNVFPLRVGEVIRAYVAARHSRHGKTYFVATVVVERILDGLLLVGILSVASFMTPLPAGGRELQLVVSALFIIGAIGIWLLARADRHALAVLRWALQWAPTRVAHWADTRLQSFLAGFAQLRRPVDVAALLASSVLIWSCELATCALVIRAFGVSFSGLTAFTGPAVLLTAVNFSTMIPSAPGYVGVYHLTGVAALGVFSIPKETALAIVTVSHALQYILVTSAGMLMMGREHLSLRSVSRAATTDDGFEPSELQQPVATV
jgi:uncharacterized protein (TIRG00374 family)